MNEENPDIKHKTWRVENGKLVVLDYLPPEQEEHKKQLRLVGCESDIFTARTPEELHAIADTELEAMQENPMTERGQKLLESWVKFRNEMMCKSINKNAWIRYQNRDATDDYTRPRFPNVRLQDKIAETLKTALFYRLGFDERGKFLKDFTLEGLWEVGHGELPHKVEGVRGNDDKGKGLLDFYYEKWVSIKEQVDRRAEEETIKPAENTAPTTPDYLSIAEAAKYTGACERTIRNWLKTVDGGTPMLLGVIYNGKIPRIPRASLDPWIK